MNLTAQDIAQGNLTDAETRWLAERAGVSFESIVENEVRLEVLLDAAWIRYGWDGGF